MKNRSIEVIRSGPMTLIQDFGRFGFEQYGVSVCGAVDQEAFFVANRLVSNSLKDAVFEITFGDASFHFHDESIISITGADMQPELDGINCPMNLSFLAKNGSVLKFNPSVTGLRSYLAISGGVLSTQIMGSRSMHVMSGFGNGPVKSGEIFNIGESRVYESGFSIKDYSRGFPDNPVSIGVILGPQDHLFTKESLDEFFSSTYVLTNQSDRQGLRLSGNKIPTKTGNHDIVSDPVTNGSIQIPGDGNPIVLLSDRQTTGGYPKIGTVATVDLSVLGQLKVNDSIIFHPVEPDDARERYIKKLGLINNSPLFNPIQRINYFVDGQHVKVGTNESTVFIDEHALPFNVLEENDEH